MSESSVTPDKGQSVATEPTQVGSPAKPNQQQVPGDAAPAPGPAYRVVSTGTEYRDSTLPTQIAAMVKRNPMAALTAPAAGANVSACVSAASGGRTPVVVDVGGHYKGSPVTVVVVKAATPGQYDAILAGPGCTTGHPNILNQSHAAAN
jgi:hypothetical protein